MYSAAAGGGARTRTATPSLRASERTDLAMALVGTGFGYDADPAGRAGRVLVALLPRVRDVRRIGSAAVDLCRPGAGRLDAHVEPALNPWDHAAGGLVAREAGAVVAGPGDDVPARDLAGGAAPGGDVFGPLVRQPSARHVGPPD